MNRECGEVEEQSDAILASLRCQENSRGEMNMHPYRKPTLVGGDKRPKVNGRTFVKELGNLAP